MLKNKFLLCLSMLFFLLFLTLLISCSGLGQKNNYINPAENPTLVDQSWYSDKKCVAPCWHGLEVGVSTQKEALAVARTLTYINFEKSTQIAPEYLIFPCKSPADEDCIAMGFEDEKLTDLWIYPNYKITFEQVIQEIGPPDSFFYARTNAERKSCVLYVLWIKQQLILSYGDRPTSSGDDLCDLIFKFGNKLPEGLLVGQVNYITSNKMSDTIVKFQKPDTGYNYVIWNGFAK
jgi:hypothetical protein